MANNLTGDYDVVVQLSVGAVERIAAALHAVGRVPHSLSIALDDRVENRRNAIARTVFSVAGVSVTDAKWVRTAYREATDGERLRTRRSVPANAANFSALSGVALVQLGPPAVRLFANQTANAEIRVPARIRYVADPGTRNLSPFLTGEIVAGFEVRTAPHPGGGTDVQIGLDPSAISFSPAWSQIALTAVDQAAINTALSKIMRQVVLPSAIPTPTGLLKLDFKALPPGAIAVMLNVVTANNASPAGVNNVFLSPNDQFALAVSGEVLTRQFADGINAAIDPNRFTTIDSEFVIDYGLGRYVFNIYTGVRIGTAAVSLVEVPPIAGVSGFINLTIPVSVAFGWFNKPFFIPDPVDFQFTIRQTFTLTVSGTQVGLQRVGTLAVDLPNNILVGIEAVLGDLRGRVERLFNDAWTANRAQIQQQIRNALSADRLLSLIGPLMQPPGSTGPSNMLPQAAYTGVEIRSAGIVLHGSLGFPAFPAAEATFVNDPQANPGDPEYSALNSWIPGGTIGSFEWSFAGATAPADSGRFVSLNAPRGMGPVCLTISGSRGSASGPVVNQAVTAGRCAFINVSGLGPRRDFPSSAAKPSIAFAKPTERGLEFVARTSPWSGNTGSSNMLVHFPAKSSLGKIERLPMALGKSARTDTATSLVCVLTKDQMASAPFIPGVMYSDDPEWEKLLEVRKRPSLVLLSPSGQTIWRHEGDLDTTKLSDVLRRKLVHRASAFAPVATSAFASGDVPPNFMFEFHGEPTSLRKLAGRAAVVAFVDDSAASKETLRHLRDADAAVLAIQSSGEPHRNAKVICVTDTEGTIAQAYGVTQWPTTFLLDSGGRVREVRFGRLSQQDLHVELSSKTVANAARNERS